MNSQSFLKRIRRRIEGIDEFYLAMSPGLEPRFLYKFLVEEGFHFKPIVVVLDERTRSFSKGVKGCLKLELDVAMEDILRFFPKKKYFVYYNIVRRKLEQFGMKEGKYIIIPESLEEVFVHILNHFLSGDIHKIYKHFWKVEEFFVINPIFDIKKSDISLDEYEGNPYKEDKYYKTLLKIVSELLKFYEDPSSFLNSLINRNLRTVNLKILRCERCGYNSLSKFCELCKIINEVKRELKREEKERNKKPKRRLKPVWMMRG